VGIDGKKNWVAEPRHALSRDDAILIALVVTICMVAMFVLFG
jgi:hypothetical protein